MRLIDGDRLEEVLTQHGFPYCGESEWNQGVKEGLLLARLDVDEAPTIEAEPVRYGKWIDCTSSDHWKCSKCGYKAPLWWDGEKYEEWLSQYCPKCGAKMEGVEE